MNGSGEAHSETGRNDPAFIQIPHAVFIDPALSHAAKLLFGRLKLYAGKDGKAFPKHETLAREMCISDRQVRTLLTELKALNRIDWTQTRGSCHFEIKPPEDWKKTSDLDRTKTSGVAGTNLPTKTGRKLPTEKKYRKSSSKRRSEKQDVRYCAEPENSTEQHSCTHQRPALSSKVDDDEMQTTFFRKRLQDPKQEFAARLKDRHGDRVDSERTRDLVSIDLANLGLTLGEEFLDFEAATTTNPSGLHNAVGHYRRLAKKFSNERAKKVIEDQLATRALLTVIEPPKRCETCKGGGRLTYPDGGYCTCRMGTDLKQAEERCARDREKAESAAAPDPRDPGQTP